MLAILRGANGRCHEVDFKGEPLFVTTAQGRSGFNGEAGIAVRSDVR